MQNTPNVPDELDDILRALVNAETIDLAATVTQPPSMTKPPIPSPIAVMISIAHHASEEASIDTKILRSSKIERFLQPPPSN